VRVGFGSLTCQRGPGDARSDGERYREALDLAAEAERLGFDSVWLSEHHFFADGYTPSPLVQAGAVAARTDTIAIGTGVLLAPLHNPVRLAEDAATAQLLADGRFVLGIAQGWKREEFEGLGIPYSGRHQRFEEIVAALRSAWADGPVTPKPDPPPPIWIGGMSEPAVRRAGRLGDAYLASWCSPDDFRRRVEWAREENPDVEVAIVLPTFAWEGDYRPVIRAPLEYYVSCFRRAGSFPDTLVAGSPDEVAERMLAYERAAGGALSYTAEFCWPGLDRGVLGEAMAVLAERVLPLVRQRPITCPR
jgi:alkanesulfonate monooxygenase SsuD/methylene tetrahydromethanopterin reductase-like flavin-dependent oxidoreductase (luciferase family)